MFNEEAGAAATIASLLAQTEPAHEIALSLNGSQDRTGEVVRRALSEAGYALVHSTPMAERDAVIQRWHGEALPRMTVLDHVEPTSKADSINALVAGGHLASERILVVDGDTVLDEGFVAALLDDLYRLRRIRRGPRKQARWVYELEDVALQSGAVLSLGNSRRPLARLIALARSAEYAFAALIRTGQGRRLAGPTFGRSRLYTAVGCGFAARRDSFPMPSDTHTEDHDFTLAVQSKPVRQRRIDVRELDALGFRFEVAGQLVRFSQVLEAGADVRLSRTPDAVLVAGAQMRTEDPHNLPGYLKQVERWNTGALESALKRLGRAPRGPAASPNVRFAFLAAQFENLVGLTLLLLLPLLLGLNHFVPSFGFGPRALLTWLAIDAGATIALVASGYLIILRARGTPFMRAAPSAAARALLGAAPLLVLRPLNALAYLTALSRLVTNATRRSGTGETAVPHVPAGTLVDSGRASVTWERPGMVGDRSIPARTAGLAASLLLWGVLAFAGSALIGSLSRPGYRATWDLIYVSDPLDQNDFLLLPIAASAEQLTELPYCSPATVAAAAGSPRLLGGAAEDYQPLSPWGLLMLGRLVPLLSGLETAATSYDVEPSLLLRVLINESFLDPLAIGPTNDVGLAQMTSDALTLLRSVSNDPRSRLNNPGLFAREFSLFDPEFSLCSGAAKLAWSAAQPGGEDERIAYARYINPLDGVVNGAVNQNIAGSVTAMTDLHRLTTLLGATVAAYREAPATLAEPERRLLDVSAAVARGAIGVGDAYREVGTLVVRYEVNDREFYDEVTQKLYQDGGQLAIAHGL